MSPRQTREEGREREADLPDPRDPGSWSPYDAPVRIRWARIAFAICALAALIALSLVVTLHPAVTTENDAIINQVIGGLIALNMLSYRFFFTAPPPPPPDE